MDREKAQKLAEAFKDDWEIDPKEQHGLHKKTGFEIDLGPIWYQDDELHYSSVFWYNSGYGHDGEPISEEEVNELQREFGILYEAGYMPGLTDEEQEQENLRIDREAAKVREEFVKEARRQKKYWEEHPQEYEEFIANNRRMYAEKQLQWYKDHGLVPPKELTNER